MLALALFNSASVMSTCALGAWSLCGKSLHTTLVCDRNKEYSAERRANTQCATCSRKQEPVIFKLYARSVS